jgi:hypothetical protein
MLDYLDDIASDMSVFHRVDDVMTLDGPTFFRLAWRLPAYTGVMQARAIEETGSSTPAPASTQQPFTYGAGAQRDINPGTKTTLLAEPAFAGVFSFG